LSDPLQTPVRFPQCVFYSLSFAGGRYWYLNDDELLKLGKDADVWIFASARWNETYAMKKDTLDQFKAVQNKLV